MAMKKQIPQAHDLKMAAALLFHAPLNFHVMIGSQEQIIEQLLERRERYGLTYVQVTDQAFDLFAPIVARLAGK